MHVLFVHRNFPGQFVHIARHLVRLGHQVTYACLKPPAPSVDGIRVIAYQPQGGATAGTHFCGKHFEDGIWHSHAVYETMKAHPELQPDLCVGFSSFGSTLFLADLYRGPIINYFEYYHQSPGSALEFRPDFPPTEPQLLRARAFNAMNLLNLQTCTAGYSPMEWQRSRHPTEYQSKLTTIFDGIDRSFWRRRSVPRRIGDRVIGPDTRIVTHVSSGMDPNRGFDIFMKVARRIYQARPDVVFVVVGSDRVSGSASGPNPPRTFREHVLGLDHYDLSRFLFTGYLPEAQLVDILSLSDLHIYLTVPFVLSWSMMNALACECTVLASRTPPVIEVLEHEKNGLLADFYDVDEFTRLALKVLEHPDDFRFLGKAGAALIDEKYSVPKVVPKLLKFYEETVSSFATQSPRST